MSEHRHRRRKHTSQTQKLKRLLQVTGFLCLTYLITYLWLFASGEAENPEGFIQGDVNQALYFIVGLCYLVNLAAAIKSYTLGEKYKTRFRWFWLLAALLTIFFVLFVVLNYMNAGASQPNEFMQSSE